MLLEGALSVTRWLHGGYTVVTHLESSLSLLVPASLLTGEGGGAALEGNLREAVQREPSVPVACARCESDLRDLISEI
jgi:hypothetical protein